MAADSTKSRPKIRTSSIVARRTSAESIAGIWAIALASFILAMLYWGREILVPLALAALLTFLLVPFVARLQRYIGRTAAVILTIILMLSVTGMGGWMITRQSMDLAKQLPSYQENLRTKIQSLQSPGEGTIARLNRTIGSLLTEIQQVSANTSQNTELQPTTPQAVPVEIVANRESGFVSAATTIISPLLSPLGTAGLVIILLIFMLLKSDDLISRFIRLVGQGRISSTSRAIEDASHRIRRYLFMQLIVNVTYGAALAIGLYFIGVPNAVLWGSLAAMLRFIPYVGPWISAIFPVALSLAVSPDWTMPLLTIGLFLVLELLSNNVMEPWLYGSSTGVSSFALIVAAVFWTWLWGPVGLVMATPLTVCLVVMGQHIPQLGFLSVLLSENQALTPAEDIYYRILRKNDSDIFDVVESYLKTNTSSALYDEVLIPLVTAVEEDFSGSMVNSEQKHEITRAIKSIMDDVQSYTNEDDPVELPPHPCTVYCFPARAERDGMIANMLARALRHDRFEVHTAEAKTDIADMLEKVSISPADIAFVSALPPTTPEQVRRFCKRIRGYSDQQKIAVGLWGWEGELTPITQELKDEGVEIVVTSIAEAVAFCEGLSLPGPENYTPAPHPENELDRQRSLESLPLDNESIIPLFKDTVAQLSHLLNLPVASISFIDGERQVFKAAVGLPDEWLKKGSIPRTESICAHAIYRNEPLIVEDLQRDKEFANNKLVKEANFRFYAAAPIHAPNGDPVGIISVLGTKPRHLTRRERRRLIESANMLSRAISDVTTTSTREPSSDSSIDDLKTKQGLD